MGDPFRDRELSRSFRLEYQPTDLDLAYLRVADCEVRELALEREWTVIEWGKLARKALNMAEVLADNETVTISHLSQCLLYLLNTIEDIRKEITPAVEPTKEEESWE